MRVDWAFVVIGTLFLTMAFGLLYVTTLDVPLCADVTGNIDGSLGTPCRDHVLELGRSVAPGLVGLFAVGLVLLGLSGRTLSTTSR